jgi:2-methylfumaryl-CoA hydratase
MTSPPPKTSAGRFFEDFRLGETLRHATPRTLTDGDRAAYMALYAPRHALTSAAPFAAACGLEGFPLDPWLVFHTVFGKTVPDISLNAVANLGYADGRWLKPVRVGDTLTATSEVIGLKQTSNGQSGVAYVRTTGRDQTGEAVLSYVRWVLVRKRDAGHPAPPPHVPDLPSAVTGASLRAPEDLDFRDYDFDAAGSPHAFEDYAVGERIDHVDGMAVEEAEAQMATRLYQNTAKVHFNAYERAREPSGRRLVYGGVVISTARALSYNGLENAAWMLALNGGRHVNPYFAGGTLFAWSEVLERVRLPGPGRIGALRLRTIATKDRPCGDFPGPDAAGKYPSEVCLDLDYWAAIPARTDG